jgi:hypothetical protein
MNYKLYSTQIGGISNAAMTVGVEPQISFAFDLANTDDANFKKEILADEAQLQDADGNVMADAKAYVASLP